MRSTRSASATGSVRASGRVAHVGVSEAIPQLIRNRLGRGVERRAVVQDDQLARVGDLDVVLVAFAYDLHP